MSVLPTSSAANALAGLSTTTPNSSPITIGGLASGLNTNQIIQGLLAIDQQQIQILNNQETQVTSKQTVYKQMEADLLGLQNQISTLAAPHNSVFDVLTATPSDSSVLSAAASSSATTGIYNLQVSSLASAQQIASEGFASAQSTITQGTLQIGLASGQAATITIDGSNNTLAGLANAINKAGVGVTATIVNDGSATNDQPFRLLLTSTQTGTSNAIAISNSLAADNNGAVKPDFQNAYIGPANIDANFSGTAVPTANTGTGGFTGTANNTYRFTVTNGGTVGTDNNIQISYSDNTGVNTGTITLSSGDANALKNVAQGIQVRFASGTLVAGQTFAIKAYVPTVQKAANAAVILGSGPGALTITSATNQINNLINGVTLNLKSISSGPISLTIAADTTQASQSIQHFVQAYNTLMTFIGQQTTYDKNTGQAGPLLGDFRANNIQDQVRSIVQNAVPGINPLMNQLGALGITTAQDGTLVVNQTQLNSALSGSVAGVTLGDVRKLFTFSGSSTNPGVQFVIGSDKTKAATTPYQVQVTQAASQASITAGNALAASTTIDGSNDTFSITVDGALSSPMSLAHGSYTVGGLAQAVQGAINGNSSLPGRQVTVGLVNGNQLAITSATFGSASQVAIGTGNALTALGFNGSESGQGKNVAGNFIVNGVVEPASGTGQILTGAAGNANTSGLEVLVTLTAAQITPTPEASLTVSRGIASRLNTALNGLLDPISGRLTTIDQGFQDQLTQLKKEVTRQNQAMAAKQQSLANQFAAMEQTIAQLQSTSNFLTTQFNTLLAGSFQQQQQQKGTLSG